MLMRRVLEESTRKPDEFWVMCETEKDAELALPWKSDRTRVVVLPTPRIGEQYQIIPYSLVLAGIYLAVCVLFLLRHTAAGEPLAKRIGPPAVLLVIGAGLTVLGELARITGLSRPDAGKGNQALVKEGYAEQLATGVYRLRDFEERLKSAVG